MMRDRRWFWQHLAVWLATLLLPLAATGQTEHRVLYGFTAFPYDLTQEAVDKVHQIILPNSNIYAIHIDGCLPWLEALEDKPFPQWLQRDWQDIKTHIRATHTVYVAVTPTAVDRNSIASSCGENEGEEKPAPFSDVSFNHPDVMKAYVNYVRRIVSAFQPRYINIGIEISELSLGHPNKWPSFEALFTHTYDALKGTYPQLQIGAEFVLQSLLLPRVATQVKGVVDKGDYVGLSFYPYGSAFGVKFGAPALPDGVDQWRQPLAWVRQYTNKPLAICETGYLTQPLQLADPPLQFPGSYDLQASFLRDLAQIANRDHYLFVVWFVSVDYDRLYEKLPSKSASLLLWMHAGLFDKDLKAKPGWAAWQEFVRTNSVQTQPSNWQAPVLPTAPEATIAQPLRGGAPQVQLGFTHEKDVFRCYASRAELDESVKLGTSVSMRWQIAYTDDWSWCVREVAEGRLEGTKSVKVSFKSDREGPIAMRLEESGGEVFVALVQVGKDWREEVQSFTKFQGSGQIVPERIVRIIVADGSGVEDGVREDRTVWIANLAFE